MGTNNRVVTILRSILLTAFIAIGLSTVVAAQDSDLCVLDRPFPKQSENQGTLDAKVTVILRVEFLADGSIGKIYQVYSGPIKALTHLATDAAREIEFRPKVLNGKKVNASKLIVYRYEFGWIKGKARRSKGCLGDPVFSTH